MLLLRRYRALARTLEASPEFADEICRPWLPVSVPTSEPAMGAGVVQEPSQGPGQGVVAVLPGPPGVAAAPAPRRAASLLALLLLRHTKLVQAVTAETPGASKLADRLAQLVAVVSAQAGVIGGGGGDGSPAEQAMADMVAGLAQAPSETLWLQQEVGGEGCKGAGGREGRGGGRGVPTGFPVMISH